MDTLRAAAGQESGTGSRRHPQQQAPGAGSAPRRGLRRSVSSASMRIYEAGHAKLLEPLSDTLRLGGASSLALVSALLPSVRKVAAAKRAIVSGAASIADRAFNVPLSAFEAYLIRALKPPMYQPTGQQWILSATGLVPQHQPIHMYPKHVHDVFWHKELAWMAFKEHSVVFYKRRLLQQASRR
jgi:hypothetical protein